MRRAVMIAVALAGLAISLPEAGAKAETNSLMAVSMRTFPSDHFGRRAVPHCPPQGRPSYSARRTTIAKVSRPDAQKGAALAPPRAPAKAAVSTPAAVSIPAAPVAPVAVEPPKPAKPDVTARVTIEGEAAPVKKVVLTEASTRSGLPVPAAAPASKPVPALAPAAPAAPATCKQFVPAVGLMVDVACEK